MLVRQRPQVQEVPRQGELSGRAADVSRVNAPAAEPARRPRPYPRRCDPPWWARGGQLQTLFGHLLASEGEPLSRSPRIAVELADGDRLSVHERAGSSGVRVVLLHGLSGDADSDYVRRSARRLGAHGHSIWAVNLRNAGSGRGLARHPYHSGRSDDLAAVLSASHARDPGLRHVVVGFSLSGNIALLAAASREPRCDAVIAVNPPSDLAICADLLHRGFNRVYELRFVARLRRDIELVTRLGAVRARAPVGLFDPLRTLDDRFTAPVSGFTDAADYYARCSSAPRLVEVRIPTVVVSASDDPLIDSRVFQRVPLSSHITLHLERHGGHMGYLARATNGGYERWLDGAIEHYAHELLGLGAS